MIDAVIGVSLSLPSFTAATVEGVPGVRIVGYHERRWDGHQDVLILRKADIHDQAVPAWLLSDARGALRAGFDPSSAPQ